MNKIILPNKCRRQSFTAFNSLFNPVLQSTVGVKPSIKAPTCCSSVFGIMWRRRPAAGGLLPGWRPEDPRGEWLLPAFPTTDEPELPGRRLPFQVPLEGSRLADGEQSNVRILAEKESAAAAPPAAPVSVPAPLPPPPPAPAAAGPSDHQMISVFSQASLQVWHLGRHIASFSAGLQMFCHEITSASAARIYRSAKSKTNKQKNLSVKGFIAWDQQKTWGADYEHNTNIQCVFPSGLTTQAVIQLHYLFSVSKPGE